MNALVQAAERYMLSVKRLGEDSGFNKLTFFEAPISKMPNDELGMEAYRRWMELNNAGQALTAACKVAATPPDGETFKTIAEWCEQTFGPVTPDRIASRAAEEMNELLAEPTRVEEAADVVIVLSRYAGLWEAVERKMAVNRKREWRLMGDGTGYHVPAAPSSEATAADSAYPTEYGAFPIGTRVRKIKGSSWNGLVCGHYSTELTPRGICVESEREPGSVQIYPVQALEVVKDEATASSRRFTNETAVLPDDVDGTVDMRTTAELMDERVSQLLAASSRRGGEGGAVVRRKIIDVVTTLIEAEADKARQARERPQLEGWFVGQTMKRTNGEYPRELIEIAVSMALTPAPTDTGAMRAALERELVETLGDNERLKTALDNAAGQFQRIDQAIFDDAQIIDRAAVYRNIAAQGRRDARAAAALKFTDERAALAAAETTRGRS